MCDECQELRRQLAALKDAARGYLCLQIAANRATLAELVDYELPPEYDAYRQQVSEWTESKRKALEAGNAD